MSLAKRPDFYPAGINVYVPRMKSASDVQLGHKTRAYFGAPSVADVDGIQGSTTIDLDAGSAQTLTSFTAGSGGIGATADATYGRNVTMTATGTLTTGTTAVVHGFDYLGQPMQEQLTIGTGMAPAATGVKAFKKVTKLVNAGTANTGTATLGWGGALGLPYVTVAVEREIEDNVVAATNGTLTAPVFTSPQTATTGDPRGLYTPNGTLDATAVFEADIVVTDYENASNVGGLHGVPHYNG